ncbi:MAG: hypothetical protein R3C59_07240 [Planctomycetaceae bacterium]
MNTNLKSRRRMKIVLLASMMLLPLGRSACGQTTYTVIDVGLNVVPNDINNVGDVVGYQPIAPYGTVGVHYDIVHGLTELTGTRDARAINDQGDIVGSNAGGSGYLVSGSSFVDFGTDYTASSINEHYGRMKSGNVSRS